MADRDVDEFTQLRNQEDGRTIEQMIADDTFEDVEITAVEPPLETDGERWQSAGWGSTWTGFRLPANLNEIRVGDKIRLYGGAGLGDTKHGYALNGKMIEWFTPWERFARRVEWLANYDREKRERFARDQEKMDARYEALSPPLKARIDRFRRERVDFRIDAEEYEMVACVDADRIAEKYRPRVEAGESPEAVIEEFYKLPWDEQKALIPELDDGHSGNTFGGACALARALLAGDLEKAPA